jgi:hypothetical protein
MLVVEFQLPFVADGAYVTESRSLIAKSILAVPLGAAVNGGETVATLLPPT